MYAYQGLGVSLYWFYHVFQERQAAIDVLVQGIQALNPDLSATSTASSSTVQPSSPAGAALLQPLLLSLLVAQQQQQAQSGQLASAGAPGSSEPSLASVKEAALKQLRCAHPRQGSYQLCLALLSLETQWKSQVDLLQQGEVGEWSKAMKVMLTQVW
jgi:hypothetical protein